MGSVEVKVSSGQLEVSKEKNLLVWVLGMSNLNIICFMFVFIIFRGRTQRVTRYL